MKIVFDLDDTLLVSSWTHNHQWAVPQKVNLEMCCHRFSFLGIVYRGARTRFIGRVIRPLEKFGPETVEVQIRPGAIELLSKLRERGFDLALVTASGRRRIEYLAKPLKGLFDLFSSEGTQRVYCAEDIELALKRIRWRSNADSEQFTRSKSLHQNERPSLAHKTPQLIAAMIPYWESFDLLVDDSKETRQAFLSYGLGDRLISVDGQAHPMSDLIRQIEIRIDQVINSSSSNCPVVAAKCDSIPTSEVTRYVDPLYVETLRHSLAVNLST